jgi:hypothetical protein
VNDPERRPIPELTVEKKLTESAVRRRAREAVLPHAKHVRTVPESRDGKVARVAPEEAPAEHRPLNEIPEWEADPQ